MLQAEPRVVQEHEPNVGRHAALSTKLAHDVLPGRKHRVFDWLDRAVAAEIRLEIDRPVLGKIDLAAFAMGPQELACMVAAGDRHRVEAKGEEPVDRRADADLGDIPGIGVDRLVAHRMLPRLERKIRLAKCRQSVASPALTTDDFVRCTRRVSLFRSPFERGCQNLVLISITDFASEQARSPRS